jgi:uncharacterized protein (DUF362 family)
MIGMPHTRRSLIARMASTVAVAALPGCGRRNTNGAPQAGLEPHVSITPVSDYGHGLFDDVRRILIEHRVAVKGKVVLLKPNLVEFSADAPINTHPRVVHAALEAFRALGASDVRIGEGSGHRRASLDMADAAGYLDEIPGFERLFTDLNFDEVSRVRLARPAIDLDSLYLPHTALRCDLLVSLPKMKTHHWVGATLAMKNLFGLVPGGVYGWPKNILHWSGIPESIAALHTAFPRQFCLVDGIVGMEGNGPIQGTSKAVGVLVAGSDPVAVDATACRIMGLDPARVSYIAMTAARGQTREENVKQIGKTVDSAATRFAVIPEFETLRIA